MASNVDKLSKFNSAINHYAESQREKILKDIADYQARELEETANNAKIEADRLLVKELAEMRDRIMREMSHREMDSRRELLTKRQEIAEKVFERAEKALIEYTQKAEYASLMERYAANISKVLTEPGTVVYVKSGDEKYKAQIEKAFGDTVTIAVDDKIKIGGLRAENVAMRLAADETLDSILASKRGWFEENSGMAVV